MPANRKFRLEKLQRDLGLIADRIVRQTVEPVGLSICEPAAPTFDAPPDDADWQPFERGGAWGGRQQWAYFRAGFEIPQAWEKATVRLHVAPGVNYLEYHADDNFPAGPEGMAFVDGKPVGGIDNGHQTIVHPFKAGKAYDVRVVMFAARCDCRHTMPTFQIERIDAATRTLYHDLRIAFEIVSQLDDTAIARERLLRAIEAAVDVIDWREQTHPLMPDAMKRDPSHELFYASVSKAQQAFDEHRADVPMTENSPRVACVGHAHIDLAWLWPVGITRHKIHRTFATICRLLDQYPDWVFNQSSPQAYAWLEQDDPALFKRVANHIADGRWEADGAAWCEMDTNVPSGEALVRQFLYGKRYFQDKFGIDSRMLWLPDVFGYSAALPQLMKLAEVDGFVTSKISWSQYNDFPHNTFRWRGIDGSQVPTHFLATPVKMGSDVPDWAPVSWVRTYNVDLDARRINHTWNDYYQKQWLFDPLCSFGYGDGGGGPTERMLESGMRMNQPRLPEGAAGARLGKAGDEIQQIKKRADELPVWDGELYLEFHRGTYTTQAWLKRANRKNEIALHNVEWLATLAQRVGYELDKPALDTLWQNLLFTQFHDVLPGSSVGEVYDETRQMHQRIADGAAEMIDEATGTLAEAIDTATFSKPVVLFNTLSWDRSDPIRLPDGTWVDGVTVPAGGWAVIDAGKPIISDAPAALSVSQDTRTLANAFWKIQLNEDGTIGSIIDRKNDRQVLPAGQAANVWQVFADRSLKYEAWDIDETYMDSPLPGPELESIERIEQTQVRVAVELRWRMPCVGESDETRQSTITQRIAIYANSPRIDFETRIDWHEHHQLLKAAFPVDVRSTEATYQIQFGHLRRPTHRNTTWDVAKFECCAHQFVDLAEHGYGVALLNDCKYGYDVHENVIRLTCLKSPQAPDVRADQGEHVFTYSLLPHAGAFQDADVIKAAAELNNPMIVKPVEASEGQLERVTTGLRVEPAGVIADTLKPAEDGDGRIVRLYESHGSHATAELTLAQKPKKVAVVNLLEEAIETDDRASIDEESGVIRLAIKPFEVVTLRVRQG